MSDAAAPAAAKKVAKTKKVAKPKTPATHPPVAAMVTAAIKALKDRKGSSLAAIKKYISANYTCDAAKLAPFIRKFLKNAVADGKLIQTKGTGAAGSFKVATAKGEEKPKKVKKPAAKAKKAKKPAAEKKPKAKKATKAKKSPAKAKKSPAKPKKAKKSPAKPKAKKPAKAKKTTKKPAKKAAKK